MTGIDESIDPELADDLDDVEGHGLKEVVVGLSAAAVLGGGMASAAHAIPPIGGELKTPGAVVGVVEGVQSDVTGVTDPTVKMATSKAGSTVADASQAVQTTARTAMDAVRTVDGMAAEQIAGLADTVRPIVEDPAGFAGDTTRPTVTKADGEVDSAVSVVGRTAAGSVTLAKAVYADAVQTAKATVVVVDTTIADAVEGASEIVLGLQGSDADADLGVQERDMVMQAKAGNEVLGTATWQDGEWHFSIDSRHLDRPITFSVVGQTGVAPVTVHFTR